MSGKMCSGLVKDEMDYAMRYMDPDAIKAWDPKGLLLTTNTTWAEVPGSKTVWEYLYGDEDESWEGEEPDWEKISNWETISGYCKEFAEIQKLTTYCCQAFDSDGSPDKWNLENLFVFNTNEVVDVEPIDFRGSTINSYAVAFGDAIAEGALRLAGLATIMAASAAALMA